MIFKESALNGTNFMSKINSVIDFTAFVVTFLLSDKEAALDWLRQPKILI